VRWKLTHTQRVAEGDRKGEGAGSALPVYRIPSP